MSGRGPLRVLRLVARAVLVVALLVLLGLNGVKQAPRLTALVAPEPAPRTPAVVQPPAAPAAPSSEAPPASASASGQRPGRRLRR